jgi:hypothetical protein
MNSRFDSIAENPVREASSWNRPPYHSMVGGKARQADHNK